MSISSGSQMVSGAESPMSQVSVRQSAANPKCANNKASRSPRHSAIPQEDFTQDSEGEWSGRMREDKNRGDPRHWVPHVFYETRDGNLQITTPSGPIPSPVSSLVALPQFFKERQKYIRTVLQKSPAAHQETYSLLMKLADVDGPLSSVISITEQEASDIKEREEAMIVEQLVANAGNNDEDSDDDSEEADAHL
ncbi:hypothetical protein ONS95_003008 [Cadophora gregata]|uniref:uncharacterized protein n=1 Tax=Cadophora gregata TaxID=51156 RepID=UPI0026DCCB71|nr:uncharacterized protein ONS95_003008 [Cadophora gregata]KAK0108186.1 hypothetical protein ONS95_003008 [Cadophora gregata]KAK0109222.1 hypothetical protein ONS96_003045 [Cadophora gregata f. sp. sojae]